MKNNISKLQDCYGCGVCTIGCPVNIINLELNKYGFYEPVIKDQEKCIECGICLDVCAYNHKQTALGELPDIKAYAGWSKNEDIREDCTTGGIGYEIAKLAIKKGEKVCGVKYNYSLNRAEHITTSEENEVEQLRGTKYIPSYTQDGFKEIGRKEETVIFGLPCQIDSFRRYIRRFKIEDKYTLVDLFCYGVPSLTLWKRYLSTLDTNITSPDRIKFRSKRFGWHDSACIEIEGNGQEFFEKGIDSTFFKIFFSDACLNKCCYKACKYKRTSSSADIRIGDFWGKEYRENKKGVNLLLVLTPKGETFVAELKSTCEINESDLKDSVKGQPGENAKYNPARDFVFWGIKRGISLGTLSMMARVARKIVSLI